MMEGQYVKKLIFMLFACAFSIMLKAQDRIVVENLNINAGGTKELQISLVNSKSYTAFQMDIILPKGLHFTDMSDVAALFDSRNNGHSIDYNEYKNGVLRVISYSNENAAYKLNDGGLLGIFVTADEDLISGNYEIKVSNISFTEPSGNEVVFEEASGAANVEGLCVVTAHADETKGIVQMSNGEEPVLFGSTVTVRAFPNVGYDLAGWSVGGEVVSTENPYSFTAHENISLEANFVKAKHVITYMVDGVVVCDTTVEYGTVIKPIDTPTKEGFVFSGWSDMPETMPDNDFIVIGVFTPIADIGQDRVEIEELDISPGETKELVISLANAKSYTAFQMDITLPKGLHFANEEDAVVVALWGDRARSHIVVFNEYKSGVMRVISYSNDNDTYWGNTGALLSVQVTADENLVNRGTYDVKLSNISFTELSTKENEFEDVSGLINVYGIYSITSVSSDDTMGEVTLKNGGQDVMYGEWITATAIPKPGYEFVKWTIGDIQMSTNNPYSFMAFDDITLVANFAAAHYNLTYMVDGVIVSETSAAYGDTIKPMDIPVKEGYVFSGWSDIPVTMPANDIVVTGIFTPLGETWEDKIVVEKLNIKPSETKELQISLTNLNSYTAFQMDITLPEGLYFATEQEADVVTLSSVRQQTHIVDFNEYQTGVMRIISYSNSNETYKGHCGTLLSVRVMADEDLPMGIYDVKLSGISFTGLTSDDIAFDDTVGTIRYGYYDITAVPSDTTKGDVKLVNGGQNMMEWKYVTAIATPKPGYEFSDWANGEDVVSYDNPYSFSVHEDVSLVANFIPIYYRLTYMLDGDFYRGTSVAYGDTIIPINAPIKDGYIFNGWSEMPETMPAQDVTVTGTYSLLGDANGDGNVNIADANIVVNYFLGKLADITLLNLKAADVNGDDNINIADANAIVNIFLKN